MVGMVGQVATVTSKSMVSIPVRIREKYGIREGSKVEFVESDEGLLLVPLKSLTELRGAFKGHEKLVREGIRELDREHRKEARS
jgi:AbrB family looped-hinge helix DNA binding protein